jgi:hypothetical protein
MYLSKLTHDQNLLKPQRRERFRNSLRASPLNAACIVVALMAGRRSQAGLDVHSNDKYTFRLEN